VSIVFYFSMLSNLIFRCCPHDEDYSSLMDDCNVQFLYDTITLDLDSSTLMDDDDEAL
jgi:hypothetical protein